MSLVIPTNFQHILRVMNTNIDGESILRKIEPSNKQWRSSIYLFETILILDLQAKEILCSQ